MERCSSCPGIHTCIPLDGPRGTGGLLFIGEAPGKDENRRGRVFVGRTGREVDEHYLPLAGLRRSSVNFTNSIKCLPVSNGGKLDLKRTADKQLLLSCANAHLYQEIVDLEPKLLIPLGAFACHAIDPRIELDLHHGRPFETALGFMAFPMYHPARGMHEPKKMLEIRTDWQRLKLYLKGQLTLPVDDYPEPDYAEITSADEIHTLDHGALLACDTETSRSQGPYCLTLSTRPGSGRLIRATRADLLAAFQVALNRWTAPIVFHNWLYDAQVVAALSLRVPPHLLRDSMVTAFHLGNLPQGLKALSYRELGMRMQDFEDVVGPLSTRRVLDYYRQAQAIDWPRAEPTLERDPKTQHWKLYAPQSLNTKLKRFFTDYDKNPDKDVFQMWEKNWTDEQMMVEQELGPWPGMDIAFVRFEDVLHYACRDADATLRLHHVLEAMKARCQQGLPQEQWRAA